MFYRAGSRAEKDEPSKAELFQHERDKLALDRQAFDLEKAKHKLEIEKRLDAAEVARTTVTHQYAMLCLRTALVTNGGAALALLSFLGAVKASGSMWSSPWVAGSIALFTLGISAATVSTALAYFSRMQGRRGKTCATLATAAGIVAVLTFPIGVGMATWGIGYDRQAMAPRSHDFILNLFKSE